MSKTGNPFDNARSAAATITVAIEPSITPRRPTSWAMRGTARSVVIVPQAKIAKATVIVKVER
jgi:hypothetical protein